MTDLEKYAPDLELLDSIRIDKLEEVFGQLISTSKMPHLILQSNKQQSFKS